MATRKPKGVYSRNTPDWFVRSGAGACAFGPAVVGQFSVVSLFNNDTGSRPLYVYGLQLQTFGATQCDLQTVVGSFGAQANLGSPIDDQLPQGVIPGATFAGSSLTMTLGPDCGHIGIRNGTDWWPYEWPVKMLSPGRSLLLVAADTNIGINAAFWWFCDTRLG